MIIKTKIPHRVFTKEGGIRTYQPGYIVKEEDKELLDQLRMHRLYRREMYYGKLQETMQPMADEKKTKKKNKKAEVQPEEEKSEGE